MMKLLERLRIAYLKSPVVFIAYLCSVAVAVSCGLWGILGFGLFLTAVFGLKREAIRGD